MGSGGKMGGGGRGGCCWMLMRRAPSMVTWEGAQRGWCSHSRECSAAAAMPRCVPPSTASPRRRAAGAYLLPSNTQSTTFEDGGRERWGRASTPPPLPPPGPPPRPSPPTGPDRPPAPTPPTIDHALLSRRTNRLLGSCAPRRSPSSNDHALLPRSTNRLRGSSAPLTVAAGASMGPRRSCAPPPPL